MTTPNGTAGELLHLRITDDQDVFDARRRGRDIAVAAGLEYLDQIRTVTALSEISRELVALDGHAVVGLSLVAVPVPALVVTAHWQGALGGAVHEEALAQVEGVAAAARLMDTCTLSVTDGEGSAGFRKWLPPTAEAVTPDRIEQLRTLHAERPDDPLDVLRDQNSDLVEAMDELARRQEDLARANAELEETNRGVVALYAELNQVTTELRDASESKTRFWANVSHELRSPLNSVIGLSRLLLDDESEPLTADQRNQIELIRDSGGLLLTLVGELLDVAKAESGRLTARPELVDLRHVFEQVHAAMRPVSVLPEVDLVVEEPSDPASLVTDPALLGHVLRNLMSNAVKFTERGEIRLSARPCPARDNVLISVVDTGIGIPAELQQRVFEEFFQVAGPLQVRSAGTGLGLAHCRRLADLLGGTLELTSEPGVGTTVTLALPLGPQRGRPARFGRVLVVDDDPAFRAVVVRVLDGQADDVRTAPDGASALDIMSVVRPDLVLLDLDIPAPDGQAVLAAMRRNPRLQTVPVVMISASVLDDGRRAELATTAAWLDKAQFSHGLLLAAAEVASRVVGGDR